VPLRAGRVAVLLIWAPSVLQVFFEIFTVLPLNGPDCLNTKIGSVEIDTMPARRPRGSPLGAGAPPAHSCCFGLSHSWRGWGSSLHPGLLQTWAYLQFWKLHPSCELKLLQLCLFLFNFLAAPFWGPPLR